MTSKFIPCPFCKGTKIEISHCEEDCCGARPRWISCMCGCELTVTVATDEEAIAQWNERAELVALADAIRRPMGVIPDSAVGYLTDEMLSAAESRRDIVRKTIKKSDVTSRRSTQGFRNPHGHYQYW